MSWRAKWQNFPKRYWEDIRTSWVANVPTFTSIGAPPDPGLEALATLRALTLPPNHERFPDVDGLRMNALWEAVFLFHKCSHTSLAAQRLGRQGMHSWSLFNAYHSAYLGARGVMALLGMSLPRLGDNQVAIDLFPELLKKKRGKHVAISQFDDFVLVRLGRLEQRFLWEGFKRMLTMTEATCWDIALRDALLELSYEDFSRPRNPFLYSAAFWPISDLMTDAAVSDFNTLFGNALDIGEKGFLLRLCFSVYRLFEQLMLDLASVSPIIQQQFDGSRVLASSGFPVIECYTNFVSQVSSSTGAP